MPVVSDHDPAPAPAPLAPVPDDRLAAYDAVTARIREADPDTWEMWLGPYRPVGIDADGRLVLRHPHPRPMAAYTASYYGRLLDQALGAGTWTLTGCRNVSVPPGR